MCRTLRYSLNISLKTLEEEQIEVADELISLEKQKINRLYDYEKRPVRFLLDRLDSVEQPLSFQIYTLHKCMQSFSQQTGMPVLPWDLSIHSATREWGKNWRERNEEIHEVFLFVLINIEKIHNKICMWIKCSWYFINKGYSLVVVGCIRLYGIAINQ